MQKIIGENPKENQNFWNLMAQTPSDYNEFIKKELSDKSISEILKNSGYKNIEDLYISFKQEGRLPQQLKSKIIDLKLFQNLTIHLKKRMLREEFGLDPERIIEINKKFGELDWRLYSSLAIYWSCTGISISKDSRECHSALNMALAAAVLNGNLLLVDNAEFNNFTTCPNFYAFPIINNYFIDKIVGENRDDYANFYFSFANKIIPILCLYGKCEQAKTMFDNLKNVCPVSASSFATLQFFLDSYWSNYLERNDKELILNDIFQYIKISYLLNKKGMPDFAENLKKNSHYIYDKYSKHYSRNALPEFRTFYADEMALLREKN